MAGFLAVLIAVTPAGLYAAGAILSDGVKAGSCRYSQINEQASTVGEYAVVGRKGAGQTATSSLPQRLNLNTEFSATRINGHLINLTRFSMFLPEDQSNFSQDAGIIKFASLDGNGQPFSSGTVGLNAKGEVSQLNYGGKFNGRFGGFNLETVGEPQTTIDSLDSRHLLVGRSTFSVTESSSLGIIYTDGDPRHDREARTLGADFRFRTDVLEKHVVIGDAWFQTTANESINAAAPGVDSADSDAWGVHLEYPDERHKLEGYYYHFGKDFDPAMGFVNRPGINDVRILYRLHNEFSGDSFLRIDQEITAHRIESTFNDVINSGGKAGKQPEFWDGHAAERIVADMLNWLTASQGK